MILPPHSKLYFHHSSRWRMSNVTANPGSFVKHLARSWVTAPRDWWLNRLRKWLMRISARERSEVIRKYHGALWSSAPHGELGRFASNVFFAFFFFIYIIMKTQGGLCARKGQWDQMLHTCTHTHVHARTQGWAGQRECSSLPEVLTAVE